MKFKQGDKVVNKNTGNVYTVEFVFTNGFITVSDEYYFYTDERDPNEFDLIKE